MVNNSFKVGISSVWIPRQLKWIADRYQIQFLWLYKTYTVKNVFMIFIYFQFNTPACAEKRRAIYYIGNTRSTFKLLFCVFVDNGARTLTSSCITSYWRSLLFVADPVKHKQTQNGRRWGKVSTTPLTCSTRRNIFTVNKAVKCWYLIFYC